MSKTRKNCRQQQPFRPGLHVNPLPAPLPTTGSPSACVISINNIPITENPNGFPDIVINTTSPVPVVIQAQNVPLDATINLTILDENGNPDTVVSAPPLTGTVGLSTTTVNIAFPFGASRGLR